MNSTLKWLRAFATMEIEDEVLQEDDEKIIYSTHPPIGVCAGIVRQTSTNFTQRRTEETFRYRGTGPYFSAWENSAQQSSRETHSS